MIPGKDGWPMTVTKIEPFRKKKVLISLNDAPGLTLYPKEAGSYGIREGAEMTWESYERLRTDILLPRCRRRLLYYLARGDRTESQSRTKLREGMYPDDVIDEAIAAARSMGYLDDRAYAARYASEQQDRKSHRAIGDSLRRRGVGKEDIELALGSIPSDEDSLIRKAILKKTPDPRSATPKEERAALAYACRKGFRIGDCVRVYNALKAEQPERSGI